MTSKTFSNSIVCTFLENDLHFGVGGLINSLYANAFRGKIFVGFRGNLPSWAKPVESISPCQIFSPAEGLSVHFIPIQTTFHLTNYKPFFMMDLWLNHCQEAEKVFFFDPDIVISCPWSFFEDWTTNAIALCEDINSPQHSSHPVRLAWKRFFRDVVFRNTLDLFVNAGFIGLPKLHRGFLSEWQTFLHLIEKEIGDLSRFQHDKDYRFFFPDQNALNIALMKTDCPFSVLGQEGMGFKHGFHAMGHALGAPKPWRMNPLIDALKGSSPTFAQKAYWDHTQTPIQLFSSGVTKMQKALFKLASFIGRFYSRK